MGKAIEDPANLPYDVWYLPKLVITRAFPRYIVTNPKTGKPHYSNCERNLPGVHDGWQMRMLETVRTLGVRNPIIVWGHTDSPMQCQRGNNRCWAQLVLGHDWVPALLTTRRGARGAQQVEEVSGGGHEQVNPLSAEALDRFFEDGEAICMNRHGINVTPPAIEHYELEIRRRRKAGELK